MQNKYERRYLRELEYAKDDSLTSPRSTDIIIGLSLVKVGNAYPKSIRTDKSGRILYPSPFGFDKISR